ncbi:MAG: FG-GAP-like repeat-containing protein [Acidobacteriaceae bacterium]
MAVACVAALTPLNSMAATPSAPQQTFPALPATLSPTAPYHLLQRPGIGPTRGQSPHRIPAIPNAAPSTTPASTAPPFAGFYSGAFFSASDSATPARWRPLAADFNQDGKTDIVTFGSDIVNLRLGNGDGTFQAPIVSAVDPSSAAHYQLEVVQFATVADLNGDGFPDIVAGDGFGLVTLLNQKNGTFAVGSMLQPQGSSPTETQILSMAVGKTTTGGGQDVVVVGLEYPGQRVYAETFVNDGTGSFPSSKVDSSAVQTRFPSFSTSIALADVNHDGKLDLLVENGFASGNSSEIDVHLGNGDGTFQATAPNEAVQFPGFFFYFSNFTVASLTGNPSRLDLIVSNQYGAYLALANGDGTYQPPQPALPDDPVTTPPGSLNPGISSPSFAMQVEDLNGDGKPDLVLRYGNSLATYLGNGDGTFGSVAGTAALSSDSVNASEGASQIVFADFNGDGMIDFASSDVWSGYLGIGLGDGDGTFATAPLLYSPASPKVSPLAFSAEVTADLNGDGVADVLGVNGIDDSIVAALATGKGKFQFKQALPASAYNLSFIDPAVTYFDGNDEPDFNGDGKPDFILVAHDYSIAVALSNGDGTLQTPIPVVLSSALHCLPYSIAVGDVNGDKKLDMVVGFTGDAACEPAATGNGASNGTPSGYFVALGNGDGTFSPSNITFTPFGSSVWRVALVPFHGPGKPLDLIVANFVGSNPAARDPYVGLLPGNGDGTFGASVRVDSGHSINAIRADDFNHDGKPDLTLISTYDANSQPPLPGGVLLYAGNGDGTFASPITLAVDSGFQDGVFADVNGDGISDLLLSNQDGGQSYAGISVLLGTGNGTFAAPLNYFSIPGSPLLVGNFLGDNVPSIITPGSGASALLMNQGGTSISLLPSTLTIAPGQPVNLVVALAATLPNRPAPTGAVTLYDGQTQIGSGSLSNGSLTLTTAQLAPGAHSLSAAYSGDANFNPNHTAGVAITVAAPPAPDYTVTPSVPSLTIAKGSSANLTLSIAANAGLSGNVTFTCSGLPAEAACTFAPATMNVAAGQTATDTLTISTTAATAASVRSAARLSSRTRRFGDGAALAGLLLIVLPFRRGSKRFFTLAFACASRWEALWSWQGAEAVPPLNLPLQRTPEHPRVHLRSLSQPRHSPEA